MKKTILMLLMAWTGTAMADVSGVSVTDVTAQQRYPWNGKVDIVVTIEGDTNEIAQTECTFAATNSATSVAVTVVTISQVGDDVVSGNVCVRRYLWNATNDVGAVRINDLALTVNVQKKLGGVQLWENGPYWAECNVGASKPEEYGYYFWWGDTVGYKCDGGTWWSDGSDHYRSGVTWVSSEGIRMSSSPFDSSACPIYNKDNAALQSLGYIDSIGNLVVVHDAATMHLGAPWRMPTSAEIDALINNCTATWTTLNGVHGRLVTGKGTYASKSIFLPAAGYCRSSSLNNYGSFGYYWSSTSCSPPNACDFFFKSSIIIRSDYRRDCGQAVRPLRGVGNIGIAAFVEAGFTTHLKLDCRMGARFVSADGEILFFDTSWYDNGSEIRIIDNGENVMTGRSGSYLWYPVSSCSSHHLLKLEVLSSGKVVGTETAQFDDLSPAFAHDVAISKPAVSPTENASGWTEEWACSQCGEVIKASVEIPSLGQMLLVSDSAEINYYLMGARQVEIEIDGKSVLVDDGDGVFVWQPLTTGEHTIKHIAGTNVWTRTVNVTSLVYEEPEPAATTPDVNMTLGATSRALTSTAKTSGTIVTKKIDSSYTGTWSATTSADWITLTYATRNVGLPVIYTVAENKDVEARTGYVYVSGHVFTITQPGVGGSLDVYSADVGPQGGEATFSVTVDSSASWRARSNVDWISVETLCGTGETEVVYHVAPFCEVSTRSGTITAAGCTFTVNQTGRAMKLSAESAEKDYLAHDIVLTVDALASTEWGIALDASWLSIVERGSGKGAGTVTLAINENPSYSNRTATALIGTETFTIVQTGRPTTALSFVISPETTTASVKGANGVIAIEATPDLPWSATSQASWLTVMPSFSSGAGNGNVVYAATPNPTMSERSGTIRVSPEATSGVAAKIHSVTQPAATAMISVDNHTFAVDGDSFAVAVTVDDVVGWTIVENVDWLSVDGAMSRNGPDSVTIAVEPNMSIEPREATITIAGHEFHVTQRGRTISLEYGTTVFAPDAYEEATIEVHPNGEVEWTAVPSDATWIAIWSEDGNCTYNDDGSVSGTGDATLKYMVTAYVGDGGLASGWIQIGNERVYVYQRGYDLLIDPCATEVEGNAGAGTVGVPATEGQLWNAIATEPWITVVNTNGTGAGTVQYTFTENDTGVSRTGKIIISGEEYTITQAARQMVTVTATVMGDGGTVSGGGTYTLGTSVTLTAVVSDDDHKFVEWEKNGSAISTASSVTVSADVDQEIVAVFEKIKTYVVNDEEVKEGTIKSFTAPSPVVLGGTTQLVCLGTSAYPNKGTSFQMQVTGNIDFDWDLWQTNYLVAISQTAGGTVSGTTGWVAAGTEVTFTATPAAGKSLYRWEGFDGGRGATALPSVSSPVLRPMTISAAFGTFADTLATAADAPSLTFTTGGEAAWTPVIDATAQTGYSSIRSGAIGTESESWVETTVFGAETLAFRWKTDCEHDDGGEATWDRLAVFVNGVEKARLDGTTSWQSVELPLTDTKSVIRWSFYRDDYDVSDVTHENYGWIDGLEVR